MRWVRRIGGLFTEELIEEPEPIERVPITHVEEEVPKTTRELSPAEKLRSLEEVALALGISQRELYEIRLQGSCAEQVQVRIRLLNTWLKAHGD